MKTATIGSVSHGTLRDVDLLEAFYSELEYQLSRQDAPEDQEALSAARLLFASVTDECWDEDGNPIESEDLPDIVNELQDALDVFSPPYCYFGSHCGDGSDFGYWPSESAIEDFDGLRVSDLSEVPDDFSGEVLHVNDHGNVSIYVANAGKLTAILEVV